jgi:hypothetical protein
MIPHFRDKATCGNISKLFGKLLKPKKAGNQWFPCDPSFILVLNKGMGHRGNHRFPCLGYQAVNESLQWLKKKDFRYGKNAPDDNVLQNTLEMDNPQPSS